MIELKVVSAEGIPLAQTRSNDCAWLVYAEEYAEGDAVEFSVEGGDFCEVRLEDAMPWALVRVDGAARFPIPFGAERAPYSPRSFVGGSRLISVRKASPSRVSARRNLALNPYDGANVAGMFPHAAANAQTRGEAIFAPRNAIDGIFANTAHSAYPFQSWGINRDPSAALNVDFGVSANVDEIVVTLRADFPHDSYWTKATIEFSDGSEETLNFVKTGERQIFPVDKRGVTGFTFKNLVKADDASPFPALRQIEAWGVVV